MNRNVAAFACPTVLLSSIGFGYRVWYRPFEAFPLGHRFGRRGHVVFVRCLFNADICSPQVSATELLHGKQCLPELPLEERGG